MIRESDPTSASSVEARDRLAKRLDELEYHRATEVDSRLQSAVQVEREARLLGAPDLEYRARLVEADMLQRKGQGVAAAAFATETNRWARENGRRALQARSHLVLAAIFENVGDNASCLENALHGLELLEETTPPRTRGNFLARLADAFTLVGSFDSARQRYREALAIFTEIGDVERQLNVHNNLAYSEAMAGDLDAAQQAANELTSLSAAHGIGMNPAFLDTLARVHMGLHDYAQAEAEIVAALEILAREGDVQGVTPAELTMTLAETRRCQGRLDDAQLTLDRCRAIARDRGLNGIFVDTLREQAEIHAQAGRFEQAFESYKVYHREWSKLSSLQREAAARTRQALFETAEARQEAQRYWRQARTDELTRLPNRRFVEEELPRRLREAGDGASLVVAIVDADHFKQVNDTFSHEVGDRVIRELARVLESTLAAVGSIGDIDSASSRIEGGTDVDPRSPFVARLGGEEFVFVLPGLAPELAGHFLEGVRLAVDSHAWEPLAGHVPMTVSIGATAGRPHDAQSDLLARADRCLYSAKRAGRNRLIVDFGTAAASTPATD